MDSNRIDGLGRHSRPVAGGVRGIMGALALAAVLTIAGCVVAPYGVPAPSTFDRSWSAVVGAMEDQGMQIASADRGTGLVRGRRGGIEVTSSVRTQADGTVRVEFNSSGAIAQDPTLVERVTRSYNQRMGR